MKKVMIFLSIFILVALAILGPDLWNRLIGKTNPDLTDASDNPAFQEILAEIRQIDDRTWDLTLKDFFNQQESKIVAYSDNKLLDANETVLLTDNLNLKYIKKLVRATEIFFAGDCNDRGLLGRLNSELKRYRNNIDPKFQDNVQAMRTATAAVYQVTGYQNPNEPRKGVDQDILVYYQQGLFDSTTSAEFKNELARFERQPYLKGCTLVEASTNKNRIRLNALHFNELNELVKLYAADTVFNQVKHDQIMGQIKSFEEMNYLNNRGKSETAAVPLYTPVERKLRKYLRSNK